MKKTLTLTNKSAKELVVNLIISSGLTIGTYLVIHYIWAQFENPCFVYRILGMITGIFIFGLYSTIFSFYSLFCNCSRKYAVLSNLAFSISIALIVLFEVEDGLIIVVELALVNLLFMTYLKEVKGRNASKMKRLSYALVALVFIAFGLRVTFFSYLLPIVLLVHLSVLALAKIKSPNINKILVYYNTFLLVLLIQGLLFLK